MRPQEPRARAWRPRSRRADGRAAWRARGEGHQGHPREALRVPSGVSAERGPRLRAPWQGGQRLVPGHPRSATGRDAFGGHLLGARRPGPGLRPPPSPRRSPRPAARNDQPAAAFAEGRGAKAVPGLGLCSASFLRLNSQQGLGAVTAFPVLSWPFGSRRPDAPGVVGAERPPPLASPRPAPFLWMGLSSPEDAERCPQRLPRAVGRTRHRAGRVVGPLLSPRHPSSLAPRSWVSGVLRHSSGRPRSGHC